MIGTEGLALVAVEADGPLLAPVPLTGEGRWVACSARAGVGVCRAMSAAQVGAIRGRLREQGRRSQPAPATGRTAPDVARNAYGAAGETRISAGLDAMRDARGPVAKRCCKRRNVTRAPFPEPSRPALRTLAFT